MLLAGFALAETADTAEVAFDCLDACTRTSHKCPPGWSRFHFRVTPDCWRCCKIPK
ncbi:hypothetical protein FQN57_002415 [Myotisia sp. PD_48]|nr:hypothetical protein FQN57_002415 [Myotisia sp. PD_48]